MGDIRFKLKQDTTGWTEFFAMVDCEKCGSTFSSGEWMRNSREAAETAKDGLAGHKARYPDCKRPVFK